MQVGKVGVFRGCDIYRLALLNPWNVNTSYSKICKLNEFRSLRYLHTKMYAIYESRNASLQWFQPEQADSIF